MRDQCFSSKAAAAQVTQGTKSQGRNHCGKLRMLPGWARPSLSPVMKRWLLFALICSVGCLGLSSPAQASANGPAAVLEEHCYMDSPDTAVYGVKAGVSGFPPNVDFTASLDQSLGGGVGPGTFTTSSNGDFFGYLGLFVPATWTLTVDSPYLGGTVTKTLTVTCPNGFADFPGNVSGAVVTGPKADVRRVIWPKTVAGLLSKGVRVRVGCDKSCRVT